MMTARAPYDVSANRNDVMFFKTMCEAHIISVATSLLDNIIFLKHHSTTKKRLAKASLFCGRGELRPIKPT